MSSGAVSPPVDGQLIDRLRDIVGPDALFLEPDRLIPYESDGLTQYRHPPAAVVLPATTGELRRVLHALDAAGQHFVPRGAGTGLSGGALAVDGAVIVGTSRMHSILEVDPANRRARVEPGVVNAHLTRATLPHGLIYAPDPSSQSACTLGGNVAENSGGPHCLKYGVTNRYVTGLTVVLPGGELVTLGGLDWSEDELDLVGLFVGSEGCFGIATEIEVALVPQPEAVRTLLGIFPSMEQAGTAVTEIMARGMLPAALEIIDSETIRAVEASVFAAGYPTDAGAALVVEFDGVDAGLDGEAELAAEACRNAGATEVRVASTEEERQALWRGRKKAFGAMGRLAPDLLVQDATVPRSKLPAVLARIGEIGRRYELLVANVFHAGDGNLHPNLLFDRRDADALRRVEAASREVMNVCVEAGGTITGEHGVGVDKRKYMPLVHSDEVLDAMRGVKRAFDPRGCCNPGKVLPDPEEPAAQSGSAAVGAARERRSVDPGTVRERLRRMLGDEAVDSSAEVPTARPESVDQVVGLMRVAAEEGWRVRPVGTGLDPRLRGAARADLLVSSAGLPFDLDHAPVDLNVRVGAGVRLGSLNERVASGGQWLALDPPGGAAVTVGGMVATGVAGPLRILYGRPRDQVLGLTLVEGTGRVLSLGGRVVKNVAGFDLVRLATGSRGRLGMITEVTLRLYPQPAEDRTLVWCFDEVASGWTAGRALAAMPFPVAAAELLVGDWPAEIPEAPVRVAIRLTGSLAANQRITEAMSSAVSPPDHVLRGSASQALAQGVANRDGAGPAAFRARGRASAWGSALVRYAGRCDRLALHLLDGTLRGALVGGAEVGTRLEIRDHVEMSGGRVEFLTGEPEPVEGPLAVLTEDLRRVFDPHGVFP